MNEAGYALLGVAIGAVIPALAALYANHAEGKQAAADRQDARDARLFDHRREAYEQFIRVTRNTLDWAWHEEQGIGNAPPFDYDSLDPVLARESDVLMYGTPETAAKAREVFTTLNGYAGGKRSNDNYKAVEAAIRAFTEAARRDLGVPSVAP
ncbi:hypothetical protein I601_3559 [Nocardioides dokdonensis FR1436]|uniref:DUF4129 domain-containing protein n=1 Tax=Nocardioides dokdonensis FR1436 TaxID=1300347 RepID=A0A1A9GR75_9ACTN|nr:hypothetical protein [Nocardioides dokdonensis]ANH39965.1 hypothetical protein I601_3559 [Nocardioides dokdonensis FR1436]